MLSEQKRQALVANQSKIAQKILSAVPKGESWNKHKIMSEMFRMTGNTCTTDIRTMHGCLDTLKHAGLIIENPRTFFRQVAPHIEAGTVLTADVRDDWRSRLEPSRLERDSYGSTPAEIRSILPASSSDHDGGRDIAAVLEGNGLMQAPAQTEFPKITPDERLRLLADKLLNIACEISEIRAEVAEDIARAHVKAAKADKLRELLADFNAE